MNFEGLGRLLIMIAAGMLAVGLVLFVLGRLGVDRLPGDIVFRRGRSGIYFPIVTSLIISVILTIIINIILWWGRR